MRRADTLIVGGGPAGTAAAITLAAAGRRPLVLERTREPADALCGGFLSWRTIATLARLGVDAATLGGVPVTAVRLVVGARMVETRLPAPGAGLSRRRLDAALLGRAAEAGAAVERGVAVRAGDGLRLRLADGGELEAGTLVLATGKHELRGHARPRAAAGRDPAVGLRVRLASAAPLRRLLDGAIELHAFAGGYAGLVAQEDGTVNLCMAVRRSRLSAAAGDPATLLAEIARECPHLDRRITAAAGVGGFDAVAQVPYGWRARRGSAALFRVGDQAGVIPSLAGEGLGIALASGIAAGAAIVERGPAGAVAFQRGFAARLVVPLGLAGLLRGVAERPALAAPALRVLAAAPSLVERLARATRVAEPRASLVSPLLSS